MSKKPTPKQKLCQSRSRKRFGTFQTKTRKKLTNLVKLVSCPSCGAKVLSHTACKECGKYRGREVLDIKKDLKKITKIKA